MSSFKKSDYELDQTPQQKAGEAKAESAACKAKIAGEAAKSATVDAKDAAAAKITGAAEATKEAGKAAKDKVRKDHAFIIFLGYRWRNCGKRQDSRHGSRRHGFDR